LVGLPNPPGGQLIDGKYRLGDVLRETARARVYRAEHVHIERAVEVKLLAPGLPVEGPDAARLVREARAAGVVAHRNVQSVVDSGNHADGRPFIVYEPLDGESLDAIIVSEPNGIPPERAASLVIQLLEGLCAIHAGGVIHRALGPACVFVVPIRGGGELVKLTGFDEAVFAIEAELAEPPLVLPPLPYVAPELRRRGRVEQGADIYSAGVILRAMLTGSATESRKVSDTAARAIARATAPQADERFPDARLLLDAVALLMRGSNRPSREDMPTPGDPLEADLQYLKMRRDTTSAGERRVVGEARVHLVLVLLVIESVYKALGPEAWRQLADRVPEIDQLLPGSGNTEANRKLGISVSLVSDLLAAADGAKGRGDLAFVALVGEQVAARVARRLLPELAWPLSPAALVDSFEALWKTLTRQGRVTVRERDDSHALVVVWGEVEPSLELAALMSGIVRQLLREGGSPDAEVQITACEAVGDASTVFQLRW
jgi:serine/threonine-protein kinase